MELTLANNKCTESPYELGRQIPTFSLFGCPYWFLPSPPYLNSTLDTTLVASFLVLPPDQLTLVLTPCLPSLTYPSCLWSRCCEGWLFIIWEFYKLIMRTEYEKCVPWFWRHMARCKCASFSLFKSGTFLPSDWTLFLNSEMYRNCEERQGHHFSFVSKYSKLIIIRTVEEWNLDNSR